MQGLSSPLISSSQQFNHTTIPTSYYFQKHYRNINQQNIYSLVRIINGNHRFRRKSSFKFGALYDTSKISSRASESRNIAKSKCTHNIKLKDDIDNSRLRYKRQGLRIEDDESNDFSIPKFLEYYQDYHSNEFNHLVNTYPSHNQYDHTVRLNDDAYYRQDFHPIITDSQNSKNRRLYPILRDYRGHNQVDSLATADEGTPSITWLKQPPVQMMFSNSSGGQLDCEVKVGKGSRAYVTWVYNSGRPVHNVSRIPQVRNNILQYLHCAFLIFVE